MAEMPQMNGYSGVIKGIALVGDLFLVNALYWLFSRWGEGAGETPWRVLPILSLCYVVFLLRGGIVVHRRGVKAYQVLGRVFCNVALFSLLAGVILSEGDLADALSPLYAGYVVALFVSVSLFRLLFHALIKEYRRRGGNLRHAVLVGSTDNNLELYHELTDDATSGYRVHGYFDHAPREGFPAGCPYLGTPSDVAGYLAAHPSIDQLYCCLPSREREAIVSIIDYCENHLVHFFSVPNVRNYLHNRMYMQLIGGVPVLSLRRDPLSRAENRLAKRLFDIAFSGLFLCTLFPLIFLFVAAGIKLTMPGPIFFRQKRNGLNDREFYCIKFRSMRVNAEADSVQAIRDDPRKTRFGNFLRHTSLDEMPQFINVLLGDMSVVGPRPHMLRHTEEYSRLIDKYMVRHFVKPGITGWSQVTGFRGETRELSQMEGRVRGDIWYIEHWSLWLDLQIICKTVTNALRGDGEAY